MADVRVQYLWALGAEPRLMGPFTRQGKVQGTSCCCSSQGDEPALDPAFVGPVPSAAGARWKRAQGAYPLGYGVHGPGATRYSGKLAGWTLEAYRGTSHIHIHIQSEPDEVPAPLPMQSRIATPPTPLSIARPSAQANKYRQLSHLLSPFLLSLSFSVYHHNLSCSVLVLYARLSATTDTHPSFSLL